jgi:hypothetical protein
MNSSSVRRLGCVLMDGGHFRALVFDRGCFSISGLPRFVQMACGKRSTTVECGLQALIGCLAATKPAPTGSTTFANRIGSTGINVFGMLLLAQVAEDNNCTYEGRSFCAYYG